MHCPSCSRKLEINSLTSAKWVSVWGGKIRCTSCKSWIRRDRSSLYLTNSISIAAIIILVGALGFLPWLSLQVSAMPIAAVLILLAARHQNWVVVESGHDT
jgi:hypothetical protein